MQGICFLLLTLELLNHDNVSLFEWKSCQIDWGFDFVGVGGFGRFFLKENFKRKAINRLNCLGIKKMLLCEMEIFHFLWLLWDHYLPLALTYNDRPPRP